MLSPLRLYDTIYSENFVIDGCEVIIRMSVVNEDAKKNLQFEIMPFKVETEIAEKNRCFAKWYNTTEEAKDALPAHIEYAKSLRLKEFDGIDVFDLDVFIDYTNTPEDDIIIEEFDCDIDVVFDNSTCIANNLLDFDLEVE